MKKVSIYFLIVMSMLACEKESKIEKEIAKIDVNFETERFDRFFGEATPETLPKLMNAYPFMFSKKYPDSLWIAKLSDTLQKQLYSEVDKTFGDFSEEDEITLLFQHLSYHNKQFKAPRVITATSNVDYRNKVIVTDSILLIALDTYLGSEHEFYGDISRYITQNFKSEMIVSDIAEAYAKTYIYQGQRNTFLDDMIYFGKILYFKDVMTPFKTDANKIGYTQEQLSWAEANESNIWRYFVENELLYSTNPKLAGRFINPGPFSKFNLEFDNESPGRIAQYIGWQIVRAYAKNNDVAFNDLLAKDAEDIFKNSRFKPQR